MSLQRLIVNLITETNLQQSEILFVMKRKWSKSNIEVKRIINVVETFNHLYGFTVSWQSLYTPWLTDFLHTFSMLDLGLLLRHDQWAHGRPVPSWMGYQRCDARLILPINSIQEQAILAILETLWLSLSRGPRFGEKKMFMSEKTGTKELNWSHLCKPRVL